MGEVARGYTPSENKKDWSFGWDDDGNTCYTQRTVFYCTGCKQRSSGHCPEHRRPVGKERYYDIKAQKFTDPPRVYITHHPKKGEWEHHKTIQDLIDSPLFVRDAR